MSQWDLVRVLFEETVSLDPEARARILASRAGDDAALVRQVEALIRADRDPLPEFDRGAGGLLQHLRDDAPADALCGVIFGAYSIEEHVSSGGMAHVYRAIRRSAGTERRVALKVLRPGLDADMFLRRFQKERETLARLEHEHVVSFVDAGALPDGRPYLVMEFIDGVPLTHYARSVAINDRVRLFVRVLRTVQYAHQQMIVHRDLKPSNVLVTADGTPKLLDFGVASVLGKDDAVSAARAIGTPGHPVDAAEEDAPGTIGPGPLTPAYASPEQLRGNPITAASDLYSLGKLLRDMLASSEPSEPSVSGDGPRRISTEGPIRGDLAAIVGKATAELPADRYGSADKFADDLERYLAHEPVSARAAAWPYRARLFARRHRWPLALGAAVIIALVVGWIGADLDRSRAEREASAGWGAHSQAKVAARIFEEWIAAAVAKDAALGEDVAAHMEEVLAHDLGRLPEAETMIRIALAALYLDHGDRARASPHAERAFLLAQSTRGIGRVERERAAELRQRILNADDEE